MKTTKEIKEFTQKMKPHLPLYNELKHFNATKIIESYRKAEFEKEQKEKNAEEILPGIKLL